MAISEYETRFGTIAVDRGFITAQQLKQAMGIQVTEELEIKEHRLIGQILFDLKMIKASHIEEVLSSMSIF